MKKILLVAASAMMVFASCSKVDVNYANDGQPQEIAMFAVNKNMTKAPVAGANFLDTDNMDVVAYLAEAEGGQGGHTYFTSTNFNKNGDYWTGGRYWPISNCKINFLAITNTGGNVGGHIANTFTTTDEKQSVSTVLTKNETDKQTDLMFAAGYGEKTGGAYPVVALVFKHALSWINFNVTTPTTGAKITINSIKLNGVAANGTLEVINPNFYTTDKSSVTNSLKATWTPDPTTNLYVRKADDGGDMGSQLLTNNSVAYGNGVMIVPGDQTSFTINYTVEQGDNTKNTFEYTVNLDGTWEMAKKYTYNVSITLTEIEVNPSITNWDSTGGVQNPEVDLGPEGDQNQEGDQDQEGGLDQEGGQNS